MNKTEQKKPSIFERHRGKIVLLLWMMLFSLLFPMYRQEMTRRPLDVPISILPPGEIRTAIHIPLEEMYELLLGFDQRGKDYSELKKSLGYGPASSKDGVPVMVQWELYEKTTHALIKSREVQTFGTHSGDANYIFRLIDYVKVPPGDYEIAVKLLPNVPAVFNSQGKIVMKLTAGIDAPRTPERKLIQWIGLLMIEPLLWILEAILLAILIKKIVRGK